MDLFFPTRNENKNKKRKQLEFWKYLMTLWMGLREFMTC